MVSACSTSDAARGGSALALAPQAAWVVGLDRDAAAIHEARRRATEARLENVEFHVADAEREEYGPWTPTLVTAHLCVADAIVERAGRALARGGVLGIVAFHVDQWCETGRVSRFAYDEARMESVLRAAAFKPEVIEVEREVKRFDSVEEGLAAAVGLEDRWRDRRALVPLHRLSRGGRPDPHEEPRDREGAQVMTLVAATLTESVKALAQELGFDRIAIGPAGPPAHGSDFRSWVEAGYAGGMAYLERRLEERLDPARVLPGAAVRRLRGAQLLPGRDVRSLLGARGPLRVGTRLSRRDHAAARAPRRPHERFLGRALPRVRRHGARARTRPGGARRTRLDRQEHDAASSRARLVVLHRA